MIKKELICYENQDGTMKFVFNEKKTFIGVIPVDRATVPKLLK
jgi:hypothetical protein